MDRRKLSDIAIPLAAAGVILSIAALFFLGVRLAFRQAVLENPPAAAGGRVDPPETPVSGGTAYSDVRPADMAGQFYPSDPDELRRAVDVALEHAGPTGRTPKIVLSPHAGYEYAGKVAAASFRQLVGSGYKRAVVIGRSHHAMFDGVAADTHDAWATPLGAVAVDRAFIAALENASPAVREYPDPHRNEHSIEVMVPFLIRTLGPEVKIVPLLFGSEDRPTAEALAAALAEVVDDETVVVISSDLSHYPKYDDAERLDGRTLDAVLTGDVGKFRGVIDGYASAPVAGVETLACGEIAIEAGMMLAKDLGLEPVRYAYASSGDLAPETKDRSVGYGAVGFVGPEAAGLSASERSAALAIARKTLEYRFTGKDYPIGEVPLGLSARRGVFVTLTENGRLRGCIGVFSPDRPLSESIKAMALAAAFEDSRFQPLRAEELKDVGIEISVLSPMERIYDPYLIEVGRHGVYVREGESNGVFLPQVAAEQEWDRETTLNELCAQKAGLPESCWRDPAAELSVFTAQVFGEGAPAH